MRVSEQRARPHAGQRSRDTGPSHVYGRVAELRSKSSQRVAALHVPLLPSQLRHLLLRGLAAQPEWAANDHGRAWVPALGSGRKPGGCCPAVGWSRQARARQQEAPLSVLAGCCRQRVRAPGSAPSGIARSRGHAGAVPLTAGAPAVPPAAARPCCHTRPAAAPPCASRAPSLSLLPQRSSICSAASGSGTQRRGLSARESCRPCVDRQQSCGRCQQPMPPAPATFSCSGACSCGIRGQGVEVVGVQGWRPHLDALGLFQQGRVL